MTMCEACGKHRGSVEWPRAGAMICWGCHNTVSPDAIEARIRARRAAQSCPHCGAASAGDPCLTCETYRDGRPVGDEYESLRAAQSSAVSWEGWERHRSPTWASHRRAFMYRWVRRNPRDAAELEFRDALSEACALTEPEARRLWEQQNAAKDSSGVGSSNNRSDTRGTEGRTYPAGDNVGSSPAPAPSGDSTSAKGEDLPPLDFVAPRDAVVERKHFKDEWTAATRNPIKLEANASVNFAPWGGDGAWELRAQGMTGGRLFLASDVPRIHAELCKLRDEALGTPATLLVSDGTTTQAVEGYIDQMGRPRLVPALWRDQMVSAVIAQQVAAGGVDTPGTRAEAERWCAYLAGCVCDGMRATTDDSALRLAQTDAMRPGGWRLGRGRKVEYVGKPLGKP